MSVEAYRKVQTQAVDPRNAEYLAFSNSTAGLIEAEAQGRADLGKLARALDANRRLWSVLATDCANGDNALPAPTRAAIISLSRFVDRQSRAVLRSREEISPLIDINRMIMNGLRGHAPSEDEISAQSAKSAG